MNGRYRIFNQIRIKEGGERKSGSGGETETKLDNLERSVVEPWQLISHHHVVETFAFCYHNKMHPWCTELACSLVIIHWKECLSEW